MRLTKTLAATGLAVAASAGFLTTTTTSASAASVVPAPNTSFESGWTGGKLTCWSVNPAASATFSVTRNSHSGVWAAHVAGRAAAGTQMELTTDRTDACRMPVVAGAKYSLNLWQRSTAGAQPVAYTFAAATGWTRWFTGASWAAASGLLSRTVALPAIPAGVTGVSVGLAFPGDSTVVLDDVSLSTTAAAPAPAAPAPAAPAPAPAPAGSLFNPTFPTTNQLVTNEFAYWSPTNAQRVVSPDWEMTSGSLFARNGNGYTGKIDALSPNASSTSGTNSAVFRLNTKNHTFGNVAVQMNLNIGKLTSTSYTPQVAWDGVHIFLHYQSQFELYYASVARRDGTVVIKKKCKGGPSNGGSYYVLASQSGKAFPYGSFAQVGATVRTNANGTVTIGLQRGGSTLITATDTGVGCAPITNAGATGIRGDNAEFDFNSFSVTPLA